MCRGLALIGLMALMASGCSKSEGTEPTPGVCTGDVTISTDAERDAFAARGCTST